MLPGMTAQDTITAAIDAECQRRGWSRARLANELGWGRDQVTRKLSGERRWSVDDLDRVSSRLGIPLPVLLMVPAMIVSEEYRRVRAIVTRWYRSLRWSRFGHDAGDGRRPERGVGEVAAALSILVLICAAVLAGAVLHDQLGRRDCEAAGHVWSPRMPDKGISYCWVVGR